MNWFYMFSVIPAAWILRCAISNLIHVSEKKWKQFVLLAACWLLLDIAIFIGDKINILLTLIAFLVSIWISCEGSFWKRAEIGLLFSSTVFAFNAFRDNYIIDVSMRIEDKTGSMLAGRSMCYILVLFLYGGVKKFAPDKDYELSESMWKLLILLTATPLSVIVSLVTLYPDNSEWEYRQHLEYQVICLIVLLSFAGLFWAVIVLAKQQKLERESMLSEINRNYYELMEQQHFEIRRMKHDMANHLSVLSALPEEQREEYIRKLTESLEDIRPVRCCGDDTVNAVLAVKERRMARYGIQWKITSDIAMELPFEKTDVCALYANALDNAVEACMKLEEEKRIIILKSMAQKGLFCMTVRNPVPECGDGEGGYDVHALTSAGFWPTSKTDKENHGFGLRSISEIVERYHGEIEFKEVDGMIELFLYLPMAEF